MNRNISVIIPTRNEIKHIERSVRSALSLTNEVFVVDSGSTDGTVELAQELGAQVFQYEWTENSNFSRKMNWSLDNLPIKTTWAMRLDADEYLEGSWSDEIDRFLAADNNNVNGCNIYRWIYFLGRKMRHRGRNPRESMRILRVGSAYFEDRWLDEHINLNGGEFVNLKLEIADNPKTTIGEWINKHNAYSIKQAVMEIDVELGLSNHKEDNIAFVPHVMDIRKKKARYSRSKKYWRCFFYFCIRYFIQLGFLDGREGFLWDFYQGWWYRLLVDTKIDEIYGICGKDPEKIKKYILDKYGFEFS